MSQEFFGIFFGCFLTILSILSIPNLFASKNENITGFFKKLLLYQGWIGLIACIIGVIGFVQYALKITDKLVIILWLTGLLCAVALALLGLLLSYNLIYTYILSNGKKSEENQEKMRTNAIPLQGKMGLLGLIIGIWSIMAVMMFS